MLLSHAILQYCSDHGVSPRTVGRHRHTITMWTRLCGDCCISGIQTGTIEKFRRSASLAGYSPVTIEKSITDLLSVLRHFGRLVDAGHRLRRPAPQPLVPTIEDVDSLYRSAKHGRYRPPDWWRAWIVVSCWTCFRFEDVKWLTWDAVSDRCITFTASKTGTTHRVPMVPFVRRHLDLLPKDDVLFPLPATRSYRPLYDEMARLCELASVGRMTHQSLRRFGLTAWASTGDVAGGVIHGCRLGTLRHYVDPLTILEAAADRVKMPPSFMTPGERRQMRDSKRLLSRYYDLASKTNRELILRVAREVS